MPTLADKINKNKSILKTSKGLFETTNESIMSKIQKSGMAPGAGSSPLAASGLGVSPDQAKMAGSSAQMGAVIRESVSPQAGERRAQERMFETEEERQAKQKAEKLSNLELLGSRIGGIVNNIISEGEAVDVTKLSYVTDAVTIDFKDLPQAEQDRIIAALTKIIYDADGNPVIPEGTLEEVNAQLPEGQKLKSNDDLLKYIQPGTRNLKLNSTKLKETFPDITDEQLASFENILSKAGILDGKDASALSSEDLNNIASLFGITGETRDTIIAKINEYIMPVTDTVVDNITGALGPTVSLSDFTPEDWQAFGLTGPADLVGLLGITEAEASTMTVGELQKKVNALLEADYDRVDELTRVANDPFYPESLRKAAQAELRNLSSVGVAATEADFEQLNEAVQSADEIEVAGKTYTVDELLSDEQLTTLISAYLEDPESDWSKKLKNDLPQLTLFIENNKAALEDAMKYLDESIKDKIAIAKKNDELDKYAPAEGVDVDLSGVNKAVLGDDYEAGVFGDKAMSEGAFTIGEGDDAVTYYHQENLRSAESKFNQEEKNTYANIITTAQKNGYNELFESLVTMDSEAIIAAAKAVGISTKDWLNRKYTQAVNDRTLETALVSKNVAEQQNAFTTITGMDEKAIKAYLSGYDILTAYNLGNTTTDMQTLKNSVVLKDGEIDYAATLSKFRTLNSGNLSLKNANLSSWVKNQSAGLTSKYYSDLFTALQDKVLSETEVNTILALPDERQINLLVKIVQDKTTKGGLVKGSGLANAVNKYIDKQAASILQSVVGTAEEVSKLYRAASPLTDVVPAGQDKNAARDYYLQALRKINEAMNKKMPSYVYEVLKRTRANLQAKYDTIKPTIKDLSIEERQHKPVAPKKITGGKKRAYVGRKPGMLV